MELKNYFAQWGGEPLPGATCYLYQPGTETLATGMQDADGQELVNPFSAAADGLIQFAAPNGQYDLRVMSGGRDYRVRVQCLDVAEQVAATESARDAAVLAKTEIRNWNYGPLADDPATRPDGSSAQEGDEYHNNVTGSRMVYANGVWGAVLGWRLDRPAAVQSSISRRLSEEAAPSDFDAIPDGVTDLTAQLTAFARAADRPAFVYSGQVSLRVPEDFSTVNAALASLKFKRLPHDVEFTILVSGTLANSEPIVVDTNLNNVNIVGPEPDVLSVSSITAISGVSGAYDVTLALSSVANVEVGDYLIVRGNSTLIGNALAGEHWGCWTVTAVNSGAGTATVRNTARCSGLETSPTTGATATLIKTVLKFGNSDGLCIGAGANIGTINNLVIEGGGVGTSADYGLVVGYRKGVKQVGATSNIRTSSASARIDENVGVVNWDRSGVWVGYGSSLYCEGRMASCSNGEAGFEADTGGFITTGWYKRQPVANGNAGHGFLAFNCASIWAGSFIIACGNGGSGVASIMGSAIVLGSAGCLCNRNMNGVAAEDNSAIDGTNVHAHYNSSAGLRAVRGSSVVANNALSSNNGTYGAYSAMGSILTATDAELTNNISHGAYALNSDIDLSKAMSKNNGGYGYLCSGGKIRVPNAYASGNVASDYGCINGGYMDATGSRGADTSTGARYYADLRGFINAIGAAQTGATYNPAYNSVSSRGSMIVAKDIQQKIVISRYSQTLGGGEASYTPNLDNGFHHSISFVGSAAFTFNAPTKSPGLAHELVIQVKNNNGSTAVTPEFAAEYVTGALASISAGGYSSVYTFRTYDGTKFMLTGKLENVLI